MLYKVHILTCFMLSILKIHVTPLTSVVSLVHSTTYTSQYIYNWFKFFHIFLQGSFAKSTYYCHDFLSKLVQNQTFPDMKGSLYKL